MKVLHKIMPLCFNGTFTNIWTTIARPSCTSNTSNQFFVQCKMHIHYIWILNNLLCVQIKFKIFTTKYLYIHSFPMSMNYIRGGQISLQKCGIKNSWMPYTWYKMHISPKIKCQANCSHPHSIENFH
jgi:hypothetical protein